VAKRQTQHENIGRQTRKAIMNMVARQVPGDKGHKTTGEKHSHCCTILMHRRGFDIVSCHGYPRGPPPATAEKRAAATTTTTRSRQWRGDEGKRSAKT